MTADDAQLQNKRSKFLKLAFVALFVLGFGALLFTQLYEAGYVRFTYPSADTFPVRGIDVSHHQGDVDWDKVAATQEVQFVYLKASEGGDFKDRKFASNWQKLKTLGIPRGAYHFFTFCRPGLDQAQNFLQSVTFDSGVMPAAIDLEFGGNCKATPTPGQMAAEVTSFVLELQKTDPRTPVLYVTEEFRKAYLTSHEKLYPKHVLWARNLLTQPLGKPCEDWAFWQHANNGRVDGIQTPVDLNVFCGTAAEFQNLVLP
jgi:lysozyme